VPGIPSDFGNKALDPTDIVESGMFEYDDRDGGLEIS